MHLLTAVILGFIEGLTEFLPVSSTGHLILAGDLLHFQGDKASTFEIFIQLGAILAVVVIYWRRFLSLFEPRNLNFTNTESLNLLHIFVAMLPAGILGLILNKFIKQHLFSPYTVLIGLVLGGILMIMAEKSRKSKFATELDQLTYGQAFRIGLFQALALWPGFSRSGATIAGGLLVGTNRKTASEFSFIIAVPMMIAASGLDLLKSYKTLSADDLTFFAVGFVVSFIVALLAVFSFLKLVSKVRLTGFAYYRFVLAALFWIFFI
ncbi:undecaprenyl-diphosphate phosphatase [Effusibacillus dendaii]|uniref:Undecaprenyl-diphosphatase n=1 Tax=Effusibacillus dendaii TaxID=2743772 RepID=A0A7I8DGU3_9BACL|nr:undecaprenyl-diphosphate phosphatase [Effusibacillus dendaii]BCJ87021.1 undecaprenyl-diphosphatase 2 [Effusibacillus dendaii]